MASIAAIIAGTQPGSRTRWRADWLALGGLAILVLAVRGIWFGDPVADFDEQLYSFIGWRMLSGELPFVDWWDRKPFGLFAIFAFAHWIGGPGAMAYQSFAAVATFAGAAMVYALARPLAGRKGAAISGALYIMLISAYASYSAQSEAFHVPLMLAALLLVRDPAHEHAVPRAAAAMAICGLALQVKYTVLPQCVMLGLWTLWARHRQGVEPKRLVVLGAAFAALGLAPTVLVGLLYLAIGEWDAFFFANFVSFFERGAAPGGRFDPSRVLWLLPLALLLGGGLYSALRVAPPRDRATYRLYAIWFASAVMTVLLPRTVYPYYYAALVPGAVLLATPLFDRRSVAGLAPALVLLAFTAHILALPERYAASLAERADIARFANAIAPHVNGERKCLYVFDGPTALYRMSGGCAPSRFVYPDHLTNALETGAIGVSQTGEVARILSTRPAVIVTTSTPTQVQNMAGLLLVGDAIRADYEPLASVQLEDLRYHAWRLRVR